MADQISTNPRSYAQLLNAGVSPAQIREAINSGLNPAQLPPEYFGLGGGYAPQSVGPGAPANYDIGGIDIPPADMGDPYGGGGGSTYTPPTASVGGADIQHFISGAGNFGYYGLPSPYGTGGGPTVDIPTSGGMSTGGQMQLGGWGGTTPSSGFDTSVGWGYLPSSNQYGWNPVGYSSPGSQSTGGSMTIGGYGGSPPGSSGIYGSPIDWGYLPSSNQYGWQPVDYGTPSSFDSTSYGAYSTGSGMLPYYDPTPIPYQDTGSISTGGNDIASFGGDLSIGSSSDLGYVPQPGLNYYDAGGGTTYVYDSDWNYLYTADPFAGSQAGAEIYSNSGGSTGTTSQADWMNGDLIPANPYDLGNMGAIPGIYQSPSTGQWFSVNPSGVATPTTGFNSAWTSPGGGVSGWGASAWGGGSPGYYSTTPTGVSYPGGATVFRGGPEAFGHGSGGGESGASPPGGWGSAVTGAFKLDASGGGKATSGAAKGRRG